MNPVYILAAILIFGVLIAVHELGHFVAAKLCGVRVNEFSIGMGPVLWQREKGETRYSFRLLPIGGYCAMEGEDEDSGDSHSLVRQGFWKQFIILAAGSATNFLAGFLIILLLYSSAAAFLVPEVVGAAPEFSSQNGATLEKGDIICSLNGERVYVYSDVDLLLQLNRGKPLDLVVQRDGKSVELQGLPWGTYTGTDG
ncbi:MAG: M50 family metallopeptidase [Oscillibacter sp.]